MQNSCAMTITYCKNCGQELNEQPSTTLDERTTCPFCGGITRLFDAYFTGNSNPSGRLVAKKESDDRTEAIRVADSQKRSSATDRQLDGTLSQVIEGNSPKGEEDTLDVCNVLIERLNLEGGNWQGATKPIGKEGGIDAFTRNGQEILNFQVTRIPKKEFWQELSQSRSVQSFGTIQKASADLYDSVNKKNCKIPPNQRKEIVLVLDAMDTACYALKAVVDEFRNHFGQEIQGFGFKAIWLVGPLASLTSRLDIN